MSLLASSSAFSSLLFDKKDWLIYTAFTVDALNTFVSFPMFVIKGKKWALEAISSKSDNIPLDDADRPSFSKLWELFMVAYEGYFGFTVSTLICIYKLPESIPIFAYSLFGLYMYKLYALTIASDALNTQDAQHKGKVGSVLFFFLPCYGGYCFLHLLDYFKRF